MSLREYSGAARVVGGHYVTIRALPDPEREVTLTPEQWLAVAASYDFRCAYCGAETETDNTTQSSLKRLVLEHMVPLARGGDHALTNVVPACQQCNSKKRNLTPLEWFAVEAGLLRRGLPTHNRPGPLVRAA